MGRIFLILGMMMMTAIVQAGEVGNGGGSWVCREPNKQIRWSRLVDLFEAENEYQLKLAEPIGTYKDIANRMMDKIAGVDKDFYDQLMPYFTKLNYLERSANIIATIDVPTVTNDYIFRLRPSPDRCSGGTINYEQVVNFKNDGQVLVKTEIFEKSFSEIDKAGLVLHEAIYAYRRDIMNDNMSDPTRRYVGVIFSNLADQAFRTEYEQLDTANVCKRSFVVVRKLEDVVHKICNEITQDDLIKVHFGLFTGEFYGFKQIKRLQSDDFADVSIGTLWLRNTTLTAFPRYLFRKIRHLDKLTIRDNNITTLPADLFKDTPQLIELTIDWNQIRNLPSNIFRPLANLKRLSLSGNKITALSPDLFKGLRSVEEIYLDFGIYTTAPENLFKGLESLKHVNLEDNQIKALPIEIFATNKNLEWVSMERTQISVVEQEKLRKRYPKVGFVFDVPPIK